MEFLQYWEEYKIKYGPVNITDKGTTHDYINSYYANEFNSLKESAIVLIEIGLGDGACSLHLWRDWFINAKIYNIESDLQKQKYNVENVTNIFKDAYCEETLNLFEDESIDYLIDDGSHTPIHQLYCIQNWIRKVKVGGKIIIEDVQDIDGFKKLIPNDIQYKIFDTRISKGRYDDVIIEITKI